MSDAQFSVVSVVDALSGDKNTLETTEYEPYGRNRRIDTTDFNLDGFHTIDDLSLSMGAYYASPTAPAGDANDDGEVLIDDLFMWIDRYFTGVAANADAVVGARTVWGGLDNPYGYCGYYADMETLGINGTGNGFLYHVRHRVYDPIAGRWLQRDPAGFIDGMNLYEYCGGGSVSCFDPMGLWSSQSAGWGVIKLVGGLVEAAAGITFGAVTSPTIGGAIAGGLVAYHGLDTAWAGAKQIWYGEEQRTATSEGLANVYYLATGDVGGAEDFGDFADALLSLPSLFMGNGAPAIKILSYLRGLGIGRAVTTTGHTVHFLTSAAPLVLDALDELRIIMAGGVFLSKTVGNNAAGSGGSSGPAGFSNVSLGQEMHAEFKQWLLNHTGTMPRDWRFRLQPGENGVDGTYVGPRSRYPGYQHAELKPASQGSYYQFLDQLNKWRLKGKTRLFHYDAKKNFKDTGCDY